MFSTIWSFLHQASNASITLKKINVTFLSFHTFHLHPFVLVNRLHGLAALGLFGGTANTQTCTSNAGCARNILGLTFCNSFGVCVLPAPNVVCRTDTDCNLPPLKGCKETTGLYIKPVINISYN